MSPIKNTGRLLAHSILASAILLPTLLHAADKITLRYAVWDRNQLPAEQEIAKRFE